MKSAKGSSREIQSFEGGGRTKLPSLNQSNFSLNKATMGSSSWYLKKKEEEESKKKKRITFQLDNDRDGVGVNGGGEEQDGGTVRSKERRVLGKEGKDSEGKSDGSVESDRTNTDTASVGVGGGVGSEGSEGGAIGEDATREGVGGRGRRRGHNRSTHAAGGGEGKDGEGERDEKGRKLRKNSSKKGDNDGLLGAHSGKDKKLGNGGQAGGGEGSELGQGGLLHGSGALAAANRSGCGSTGRGHGQEGGGALDSGSEGDAGSQLRAGVHRTGEGGASSGGTTAGTSAENTFLKPTDHGKRVRKSGGYMRAVSPTSSEWGDPLHARSFISSTAASQMGSTSDLDLRTLGSSESPDPADGNRFLPPIVHPIPPPPPVSIHFMTGPDITRPWTFSYH